MVRENDIPRLDVPAAGVYRAEDGRYDGRMPYRRTGRSGLDLPEVSLGLWQNFGDDRALETQRAILRRAFDLGVTHFDLANNYGPPAGAAELNFGRILREDFRAYRDELVISTKAGYGMWPGPYGSGGGSRKYLLASLDQSLARMGLDYVDVFYSHRFDPDTPLEETMGALATAVKSGRAMYAGISSYSAERTAEAAELLRQMGVPLLIHQPSYSMVNRWIEDQALLDTLERVGAGCIVFSPLAQGLLTGRYLQGVPEGSRAGRAGSFSREWLAEENLERVRALDAVARGRGQTLAQLAISWVLRDRRTTSALIGASSVAQLEDSLAAVRAPAPTDGELAEIDRHAVDLGVNIWKPSSDR
ncbi:L-glyceraldehyde 3-phosphate reductase [Streptomonospora salina]|uniref:L-glyceraldehyde 3-phosphate reductase n=1 Tax=Streptomonospora salina TaxID=104205 RepID=A0A841E3P2_9ACTN|nr:L-glyceraldehyde 3-phosphate reductase [Streptomonospora salina]MBB5997322.1 L-glyceraldehyde 3-phosphate reductase [Streptomonospora salina]